MVFSVIFYTSLVCNKKTVFATSFNICIFQVYKIIIIRNKYIIKNWNCLVIKILIGTFNIDNFLGDTCDYMKSFIDNYLAEVCCCSNIFPQFCYFYYRVSYCYTNICANVLLYSFNQVTQFESIYAIYTTHSDTISRHHVYQILKRIFVIINDQIIFHRRIFFSF